MIEGKKEDDRFGEWVKRLDPSTIEYYKDAKDAKPNAGVIYYLLQREC